MEAVSFKTWDTAWFLAEAEIQLQETKKGVEGGILPKTLLEQSQRHYEAQSRLVEQNQEAKELLPIAREYVRITRKREELLKDLLLAKFIEFIQEKICELEKASPKDTQKIPDDKFAWISRLLDNQVAMDDFYCVITEKNANALEILNRLWDILTSIRGEIIDYDFSKLPSLPEIEFTKEES